MCEGHMLLKLCFGWCVYWMYMMMSVAYVNDYVSAVCLDRHQRLRDSSRIV